MQLSESLRQPANLSATTLQKFTTFEQHLKICCLKKSMPNNLFAKYVKITLANVDWFTKFIHQLIHKKILDV